MDRDTYTVMLRRIVNDTYEIALDLPRELTTTYVNVVIVIKILLFNTQFNFKYF